MIQFAWQGVESLSDTGKAEEAAGRNSFGRANCVSMKVYILFFFFVVFRWFLCWSVRLNLHVKNLWLIRICWLMKEENQVKQVNRR